MKTPWHNAGGQKNIRKTFYWMDTLVVTNTHTLTHTCTRLQSQSVTSHRSAHLQGSPQENPTLFSWLCRRGNVSRPGAPHLEWNYVTGSGFLTCRGHTLFQEKTWRAYNSNTDVTFLLFFYSPCAETRPPEGKKVLCVQIKPDLPNEWEFFSNHIFINTSFFLFFF